MSSPYQPGVPTGLVFLDQDYANIQQNFQYADTFFGVNHVPFSVSALGTPSGYHTNINFVPFSTVATNGPTNYVTGTGLPVGAAPATPGFGQLYTAQVNDGINTDESLFYISGGGRALAITRNFTPTLVASKGASMILGGVILNWGQNASNSSGAATVTFSQPFPTKIFSIQCTILENNATSRSVKVKTEDGGGPYSGFHAETSSGSLTFYWLAIGN